LTTNNTYLVVLRYKFNSATTTDDEVALWLDPTSLGDNSNIPSPTISTTNGADVSQLVAFYYLASSSVANYNTICQFQMDEIRIGTSWASVTPVACSPGTTFTVTGGGSACGGSGFPVGLSGSETGVDYWLVANGVISGLVTSGTGAAIDFGTQTVSGVYTVFGSNTTSTCVGWMQGSAVLGVLASPSIVTPPVPINVANNGSGTFSVTASGDGLTYQWQRHGTNLVNGGNISGATTPNLTISPAGLADQAGAANGYDVVVSGTCSPPATSVTCGLTLEAPANLVWVGGNPANYWDMNTSANWSGGSGVFNYGDNVTFDDSSVVIAVELDSSFLSPGSITVNAAQNYTFGGPGSLIGPGTLLKTGTGTLTLGTCNSFSGGMTINNGVVSFNNGLYLGTGPITLAGGTLNAANVQGITVNNPINVTADSTIAVNNTSTSALILTNSLGGSSGTLTFSNASVGARGPTIRLTGPGFTCNVPIYLTLGDITTTNYGTNFFLAGYNSSGDQVFNGVISGGATLQRSASGGTTILNTVNTYTNETTVSGGTLLVNGQIGPAPVTVTGGTLGGSGTILGPVTVTNATLAPGNRAIGTLSINNSLTLESNSTTSVEVSKTPHTNDLVRGLTAITYAGTLSATNLAGTLAGGDAFTLFSAANPTGNFSSIAGSPGAGLGWVFNPTNGVLSVITTVATNPTNITFASTNGNLTLSWPADHTGWTLQVQTNSINVGLGTNWVAVSGSATTNIVTVPINPAHGSVFYRLVYP
jgi:autotransporter-associated beta strand protein